MAANQEGHAPPASDEAARLIAVMGGDLEGARAAGTVMGALIGAFCKELKASEINDGDAVVLTLEFIRVHFQPRPPEINS